MPYQIKYKNKIFKKLKKGRSDERIIEFLKLYGKPCPPTTISFFTGLSTTRVSICLNSLIKYGIAEKAFSRKISFYRLNNWTGDKDGRNGNRLN